jgi:Protein of unknown function, DUF547
MDVLLKGSALAFLLSLSACALKPVVFNASPPDHAVWDGFLQKHVKNGQIDAAAILKDSTQLRFYLAYLSRRHPNDHWDRNIQLAYWVNLHNALFLAQKHAPSTLQHLQNKASKFLIEGKAYALRQVKNKTLNWAYSDGRSLFVLCQSRQNALPTPNRALSAEGPLQQLDILSKSYLNNPDFNQIETDQVVLSSFFRENKRHLGPLRAFVLENSNTELSPNFRLKFRRTEELK